MLTKLDVQQQIAEIQAEAADYIKQKLHLQKTMNKEDIKSDIKKLNQKIKKCGERCKMAQHIIHIIEAVPADVMESNRNGLLIKIRTIQNRIGHYTVEQMKNPITKSKVKAEEKQYGLDKLQKQYRALSLILKS